MTDPAHARARNRLTHLLRDYADAITEHDPQTPSPEAGTTTLPGRWRYFQELDTWIRIMRTCTCNHLYWTTNLHQPHCTRPMFHHLNARYIQPHARTQLQRHTGKHLPPHSERAAHHTIVTVRKQRTQVSAAPHAGTTVIATWPTWIDHVQVEAALDWLLEHMHAGDTTHINLPPDLTDATPTPERARA